MQIHTDGWLDITSDALALAQFVRIPSRIRYPRILELCAGTGTISLMLASKFKNASVDAVEISLDAVSVFQRNITINALSERVSVCQCDIRSIKAPAEPYDIAAVNPPYFRSGSGKLPADNHCIKHDASANINQVCNAAAISLKNGGLFFTVFTVARLTDLFCAMRDAGIEPKRLQFIRGSANKPPKLLLAEGRKNAAPGLILEDDYVIL